KGDILTILAELARGGGPRRRRRRGGGESERLPLHHAAHGPPPRDKLREDFEIEDPHPAALQLDLLASPREVVGALPLDLQRRMDRRHLLDLAGEASKRRFDVPQR